MWFLVSWVQTIYLERNSYLSSKIKSVTNLCLHVLWWAQFLQKKYFLGSLSSQTCPIATEQNHRCSPRSHNWSLYREMRSFLDQLDDTFSTCILYRPITSYLVENENQQVTKKKTRCKTRKKNTQKTHKTVFRPANLGSSNKRGQRRQRRKAMKYFLIISVLFETEKYFLWLRWVFFSIFAKILHLHRLFLNEKINIISWNADHLLKRTWEWSNRSHTRVERLKMSALLQIFPCAFCLISLIALVLFFSVVLKLR